MSTKRDSRSPSPNPRTRDLPENALRSLLDASPAPMWVYDAQTLRVLAVNDRALAYLGCRREQFPAMPLTTLDVGGEVEPDGAGGRVLRHHRKADGAVIALRLETSDVAVDGRPACLVVAIDVTQETQALTDSERRCRELAQSESVARCAEERFRQLFEIASDWYWEADAQGRITFISPNFEARYGVKLGERMGKRPNDIAQVTFEPESGYEALAAIKARKPYSDLVYSLAFPNGVIVHVRATAVPMFAADGEFCGYCGICKDVTEQTTAERALRESEQQYRELFEIASDYYWEHDAQHRYSYVSPSYETIFGVPASQILGTRLTESPEVSVEPEMGKMALLALKARQPYRDFVYSRKFADGTTRWFKVGATPILDKDGTFRGYRGVGAEITKSVEAEMAARLTQRRLDDAVAYVTQPFVVFDPEDRVTAFNQAFTDLYKNPGGTVPVGQGVSFRELAEWQLRVGFYAADPEEPRIDLDTLLADHKTDGEHTYHLSDGRWMLVVYRRLPGEGRVGLWTDVTAIKRAEEQRVVLETQLHHSQRLEALGTLAGGVAHEINNALVPVMALTKLVSRKLPEGSRERGNLDTVVISAERSRDLVKQILAFSRKEEQRHESFDLAVIAHEALRMMRASLPATIRLEEAIAPVPPMAGDPNQLHQVVVNLVTNAAQAIGDAMGTVGLAVRPDADGAHLRLSVTDTGCGMDEATKARIFEPFFTTKEVGKGTGLGLPVVHGIVNDHGGRIEVTSTPGSGTRFDIVLPLP